LTGLGQIMFQNSALTGVFFLAGIAVVSPMTAAGGFFGSLIGAVTAAALRYDRDEIRDGIYGFNAALVGMAMLANFQPHALTIVIGVIAAIVSTLLTHEMRRRVPFPTYTFPFVVTTWVALFVAHRWNVAAVVQQPTARPQTLDITSALIEGISEVMFEANVLTGALFIVGIMLCSWTAAVWAVVGSMLGLLAGISHHDTAAKLSLGLLGYNAALAAMAMTLYRPSLLLPVVAAILTVPITEMFPVLGLPTLTAPFVFACWPIIAMDKVDGRLYGTHHQPSVSS